MTITTADLRGVTGRILHLSGTVRDCTLNERNVIPTSCGDLIPRYEKLETRTKPGQSLSFYKSGALRSIYLEDQTEVATPIGPLPAELVSFHEDGSLNTIFQLNGQLSYAWTETDEKRLAQEWTLAFDFATITAKMIAVRFHPSGQVRSLTLWPGETLMLNTPVGEIACRTGLSVHPNGTLASFEPAMPVALETPIGYVLAYDVDAFTIDGDQNSVRFDDQGNLTQVTTAGEVIVEGPDGTVRISSKTRYALTEDVRVKLSIELSFDGDQVTIDTGRAAQTFAIAENKFTVLTDINTQGLTSCDVGCDSGSCDSGECDSGSCDSGSCETGSCSTGSGCDSCVDGKCSGKCA
ncbi:hypothetical protein [Propionicimonas sp.]|uniref:hypothetical protein n=1 Tax=Propionicimonas sp. TaxID=1955623 RepID=UPI0017AD664A|nr:hypothetical protein [Propionicimonas sp.]MBU3975362.1 hypothetical protein [Actinomycetota bacterium]MBA3020232.1 hypothetical protein [Propionicimonas sp.]MBU3986489.1 hypothetical protein [Actinomycetota bacterium]MBU4008058.1 hypothetical protein [Actinomycetota bacterium]MBU4064316.1 hypothetical protein [Actinomycetota bacterium]